MRDWRSRLRNMHWCWIDRFVEFHSGSRAKATKNFSLAESYFRDYYPRHPIMPNSMIVEGMGQTGMYLSCEAIGYTQLIMLAKVTSARFHFSARPGDTLTYSVAINSIGDQGVSVTAVSHIGDRLQGEADLLYARVADRSPDGRGDLREMARQMRLFGVYDIGMSSDGGPLRPAVFDNSSRQNAPLLKSK